MMADLRMRLIDATVDLSIENNPYSDSCSDRHVNQFALTVASAPACFSKSRSVGIVLQCHPHFEALAQISDRILSFPMRKEVDIANLARQRIHWSGRSDPMPEICVFAVCAVARSISMMRRNASG